MFTYYSIFSQKKTLPLHIIMEIVNKQNSGQTSNVNTTYLYKLDKHKCLISLKNSFRKKKTAMKMYSEEAILVV